MKLIQLLIESSDKILYHVTFTKNVPKIIAQGLKPMQTSLWKQAATGDRYGKGEVYAFDHFKDALRWSAKMDWDFNQKIGTGKISIVKFNDTGEWAIDDADPLSQASNAGKWHKRMRHVKSEDIISHSPVTVEMMQALAQDKPIPISFNA
jgi:hypothetical protein